VRTLGFAWALAVFAGFGASLTAGCGGGLQLRPIEGAHRKPSNVAVFFAVEDADGEPVADLLAADFRIYEDGQLVSVHESRQTIVNPEIAAVHYTLLLVDMSASVTESDQVAQIADAAAGFVAKVGPHQRIAIHAFDGAAKTHELTPFTASPEQTASGIERMKAFHAGDPSTNLHGAVTDALGTLEQALARDTTPLRFGTLVVFTDGTDRAARVSQDDMLSALGKSPHDVFAIGVGMEIDDATLARVGRSGSIRVANSAALAQAFAQIGERIVRLSRRYYLLSYCSPARAGTHVVTIEAERDGETGELRYNFDAAGFSPNCDASRPPPFDTSGRSRKAREKLMGPQTPEE
jgi:hypothetical protein